MPSKHQCGDLTWKASPRWIGLREDPCRADEVIDAGWSCASGLGAPEIGQTEVRNTVAAVIRADEIEQNFVPDDFEQLSVGKRPVGGSRVARDQPDLAVEAAGVADHSAC